MPHAAYTSEMIQHTMTEMTTHAPHTAYNDRDNNACASHSVSSELLLQVSQLVELMNQDSRELENLARKVQQQVSSTSLDSRWSYSPTKARRTETLLSVSAVVHSAATAAVQM